MRLADCEAYYCWEIRRMLHCFANRYCPKGFRRPDDHSTRVVEYHRKESAPKPHIVTGSRTQDNFVVCDCSYCNFLCENKFSSGAFFLYFARFPSYRKYFCQDSNPQKAFSVVPCVLATSLQKQTTFFFSPFHYLA
jgi:hypothetical protein